MTTERPPVQQVLLGIAFFLVPITCGQCFVRVDAVDLSPSSLLSSVPALSWFVCTLLAVSALLIQVFRNRVTSIPYPTRLAPLMAIVFAAIASIALSEVKSTTIGVAMQWFAYVIFALSVVAVSGRERGPNLLLSCFSAGCTATAVYGVMEYAGVARTDPSWRIFSTWINPNALAGLLLFGIFASCGLTAKDRNQKLLLAVALFFQGTAIYLTGSKGGLLALAAGIVVLVLYQAIQRQWRSAAFALIPVILGISFALLLGIAATSKSNKAPANSTPRILQAGETATQSEGVRRLLWSTSIALAKERPFGSGMGSFSLNSTKPGLVTQTQFAHNSFLQMAAEGGVFLLLAFAAMLVTTLVDLLAPLRKNSNANTSQSKETGKEITAQDEPTRSLRAGLFAALTAACAHNLVDSDLYFFGTGAAFFSFVGISMSLSSFGTTPEQFVRGTRMILAALTALPLVSLLGQASVQFLGASAFKSAQSNDRESALAQAETIRSIAPLNPIGPYLIGILAHNSTDRTKALKLMSELEPLPRNYRLLARSYVEDGNAHGAELALRNAISRDRNNLLALKQLSEVYTALERPEQRIRTLQSMIEVEKTKTFTVRALPQIVPTETYWARIELAHLDSDQSKKAQLLDQAVTGYKGYLDLTVPFATEHIKGGSPIGGETLDEVTNKLTLAQNASEELAKLYRGLGRTSDADRAEGLTKGFSSALSKLGSLPR